MASEDNPKNPGVFVKEFYTILNSSPEELHRYYKETSQISRPVFKEDVKGGKGGKGRKGRKGRWVLKHSNSLTSIKSPHHKNFVPTSVQHLDEPNGDGVIVYVKGSYLDEKEGESFYFQTFFLDVAQTDTGFLVLNDVLWVSRSFDDIDVVVPTNPNLYFLQPDHEEIPKLRKRVPRTFEELVSLWEEMRLHLGTIIEECPEIPVTLAADNKVVPIFHLILYEDDFEAKVKFNSENTYQIAFKTPLNENWLEFNLEFPCTRQIPRSTLLDFSNTYSSMESVLEKKLPKLLFNIASLSKALSFLKSPIDSKEFVEGVIRSVAIYSEGTRLHPIGDLFRSGKLELFGERNLALARCWARFCRLYFFGHLAPGSFLEFYRRTGLMVDVCEEDQEGVAKQKIERLMANVKKQVALVKRLSFPMCDIDGDLVVDFLQSFQKDLKNRRHNLSISQKLI